MHKEVICLYETKYCLGLFSKFTYFSSVCENFHKVYVNCYCL